MISVLSYNSQSKLKKKRFFFFDTEQTSGYTKLYSLNLLSKNTSARGSHRSDLEKLEH